MENPNKTASDAVARLNPARIGALVTPTGAPLTSEHRPYLAQLRNELEDLTERVKDELARIDAAADECGDCGARGPHHCPAWCDVPHCDTTGRVSSCGQSLW